MTENMMPTTYLVKGEIEDEEQLDVAGMLLVLKQVFWHQTSGWEIGLHNSRTTTRPHQL